jgi:hypothetical protein
MLSSIRIHSDRLSRGAGVGLALLAVLLVQGAAQAAEPGGSVPGLVSGIKVLPDKAPDCSSLKAIAETVTRGCKTNDERAVAIYNFMQLSHYHRAYPGEPGGLSVLKEINVYGWSLCGGLHSEESALWRALGWEWRFVGWNGHTTVEAGYDGKWHYLDSFLKFYAWMPDPSAPGGRTIAGEDDLTRNSDALIKQVFFLDPERKCVYTRDNQFAWYGDKVNWQAPSFLSCGDGIDDVIGGLKTHHRAGSPEGWAGIDHASHGYSADVNLAPGFSLTNTWDPVAGAWYWAGNNVAPAHTCGGHKDTRNDPGIGMVLEPYVRSKPARSYANGTFSFTPDFSTPAVLEGFAATENVKHAGRSLVPAESGKPGVVVVRLASPYIMTTAAGEAAGADGVEVSVDGGKSFKAVELADFSAAVKGQIAALVKITFRQALQSLKLEATVQNNSGSLPYLSPGKNTVTVSVADPKALGQNKLAVTYAYRLGSRNRSFAQLCDEGKELAKGHNATWDEQVLCVEKVFAAKDLPARFEIDCPTPTGQYPVYPRMIFVRREVLTPNQKPLALPEGSREPKPAAGDMLASLPNPFLMGCQPPPPKVERKVKTLTIPLVPGHFVTRSGSVPTSDFIKWPKNGQEKVDPMAFLIGGELTGLPPAKALVAARLVFPALRGHQSASTKVGVVALRVAAEPGQPYDFANLGEVVGTAVVPKLAQDAPDWSPPKEFKIDVMKAVRAIARGEGQFNGFALRVVPDRGVDDGWTGRVHIPKRPKICLEVDVDAEAPATGK